VREEPRAAVHPVRVPAHLAPGVGARGPQRAPRLGLDHLRGEPHDGLILDVGPGVHQQHQPLRAEDARGQRRAHRPLIVPAAVLRVLIRARASRAGPTSRRRRRDARHEVVPQVRNEPLHHRLLLLKVSS